MNKQSIEFQEIKDDSSLPGIVRKTFRIPVEDSKHVWVVINRKQYPVLDICRDSIGIALKDNSMFIVGQTIENCELNVFNTSIKELTGRIMHCSPKIGKDRQCGIQWVDMDEMPAEQISKIVSEMKEQLLKDDNLSL